MGVCVFVCWCEYIVHWDELEKASGVILVFLGGEVEPTRRFVRRLVRFQVAFLFARFCACEP